MRGYFGVGIYCPKTETNVGGLFRSAQAFGADFVFTVGRRYKRQATDTTDAARHVPLFHHASFDAFLAAMPLGCRLIGVELDERARPLTGFVHPERAVYLLGAEDHGLPETVMSRCHDLIVVPSARYCLNVATAGSIVLYDRVTRRAA